MSEADLTDSTAPRASDLEMDRPGEGSSTYTTSPRDCAAKLEMPIVAVRGVGLDGVEEEVDWVDREIHSWSLVYFFVRYEVEMLKLRA